jgi:hypothetical protein
MIVEVYQGRNKIGFLCRTTEDVVGFLSPLIEEQYIQFIVDDLLKQRQNIQIFPNVILFLDANSRLIDIKDFVNRWKEKDHD